MGETRELAEFTVTTEYGDVPDDVFEHAKRAITDYVGVAVYGSHHEVGERVASYVEAASPGSECTVLGRGTASPAGAALANGTFGHAIDYDDTFESIVIHPTSPVFPAALAAAELDEATGMDGTTGRDEATGRDVLTGYVVGCEAAFRVGHATYPSHYDHGWHNTGTVGSFGSAAAAASVLDMSQDEVRNAFGIVASCSSSLKKNFGSMTKPLHAGHAAQMGIRAALLAREGYTADGAILEGEQGYGRVMTPGGDYDPAKITDGLGDEWAVPDVGFKPYPSGVITHASMEALRRIVDREELTPGDVESITVALDEAASEMLIHSDPENALQAKFSIEFCLAAILREGDAGIHEFTDEYVAADETRAQMAKVERDFEPNLFGGGFAGYGARVVVRTADEEFVEEERHAPGSPNNPVSDERLEAKFLECATAVMERERAQTVLTAIDSLEDDDSLETFVKAVR